MNISIMGEQQVFADVKEKILKILKNEIKEDDKNVEFFFNGYDNFCHIAKECCSEFKSEHNFCKLLFVAAFLDIDHLKEIENTVDGFDGITYPELAFTPLKIAEEMRDAHMVRAADLVIFYVDRPFGQAYKSLLLAQEMNKRYINLGDLERFGKEN